jgi:hypothetical protein
MQINGDLSGVSDVLNSAILGAQLHVEAVLRTTLIEQLVDSLFYLDSEAYSGVRPGGMYRIEVPNYFIRKDTPVTVEYDDTAFMNNAQVLTPDLYRVDYDRGQILIPEPAQTSGSLGTYLAPAITDLGDKYVRVSCSTGFRSVPTVGGPDTTSDPVPAWLNEAILSYVGVIMDVSQTTNRNQEAEAQYERAGKHAVEVIGPHFRTRGFVYRPLV